MPSNRSAPHRSPRRVLFLDHAPVIGGAERSLLLLLSHLDKDIWRPHLAGMPGHLVTEADGLGFPTHLLHFRRLRNSPRILFDWANGARAITRLVDQIGAQILVANTVRAALYAAPAARLANKPLIWHMRDFWLSETRPRLPGLDRLGKKALCLSARAVIANSRAVAAQLPCENRITVVHNGIDPQDFNPHLDGNSFRRQYQIGADTPLVGMVGRLRPWKGQQRFLDMASTIVRQLPQARFVIVGGEPFGVKDDYGDRLKTRASVLGLDSILAFTGHVGDVRPALAAMDVFVHPGDPEPFGLVILEAMAMQKPIVAFDHGALGFQNLPFLAGPTALLGAGILVRPLYLPVM